MHKTDTPTLAPGGYETRSSGAGRSSSLLSRVDILEFLRLLREHCGVSLSETEAWNRATELVALYLMFLGPIPEDPMIVEDRIGLPERAEP